MLFVSSMAGAMPGCASVGVYAATKAFEKSLAASLGREMERYGVGVTCLLPGAVKDTDFASRSDIEAAVCFQIPGYAKTPELVAGEGIKAMMLGYPEVYPGFENKFFAKIALTHLPGKKLPKDGCSVSVFVNSNHCFIAGIARVAGLIGEYAWSPWPLGMLPNNKIENEEVAPQVTPSTPSHSWKFRRPSGNVLRLPELPKIQIPKVKPDGVLLSDVSKDATKLNETIIADDTIQIPEAAPLNNSTSITPLEISDEPPRQSHPLLLENQESPSSSGSGEVDTIMNETWYPSMLDQKQYDFRDRRLDY